MIRFRLIIACIFVKSSLISTLPTSSPLPNSVRERADSCNLFYADSSCLSSGDSSHPGETASSDDFDSFGSFGQISLLDDSSMPTLDPTSIAAGNLNSDFGQSQVDGAALQTDSDNLLYDFPEEPITDQAQTIFMYGSDEAYTGEISQNPSQSQRPPPVIYSYICEEHADPCAQYKDGVATGVTRYAKCNNIDQYCRLCDTSGQECDPDAGWDKQAIPSPDNQWGQPWNHCRNRKCGACETAAHMLGFLSLGVIPGCGPPKFY